LKFYFVLLFEIKTMCFFFIIRPTLA